MQKWKEIGLYIVFGVLTTLVALVVFQGLEWTLNRGRSYLLSNAVSFIVALMFAFVVNKLFVFEQKSWESRTVVREAWTFTSTRLLSFGLEYVLTIVFFEWLWRLAEGWFTQHWSNFFMAAWLPEAFTPQDAYRFIVRWGFIAVFVVALNYIFAKWVVFKKKEEQDEADIVEC